MYFLNRFYFNYIFLVKNRFPLILHLGSKGGVGGGTISAGIMALRGVSFPSALSSFGIGGCVVAVAIFDPGSIGKEGGIAMNPDIVPFFIFVIKNIII